MVAWSSLFKAIPSIQKEPTFCKTIKRVHRNPLKRLPNNKLWMSAEKWRNHPKLCQYIPMQPCLMHVGQMTGVEFYCDSNQQRFLKNPWNSMQIQVRNMAGDSHGDEHMIIRPSRFQWNKFKDMLHFYVFLGLIPIVAIVFYANVFVGPATLEEIPEDYVPKHWEYHRHPITRFLARYIHPSPQEGYEKALHNLWDEEEKRKIRQLEKQIRAHMSERNDYQAFYYRPAIAKYHRISKEAADKLKEIWGN